MNQIATALKSPIITCPTLNEGELWAGAYIEDGKPKHHVILLPGEAAGVTWQAALSWAESNGGVLPTRSEQAMLYAVFGFSDHHFKKDWYWSCEQHGSPSDYAWCQYFLNGGQDSFETLSKFRARAVRRSVIGE
jgi:hypothetical protein